MHLCVCAAGDTAWNWFDQVVGEGRCPIVGERCYMSALSARYA